jgi:hypothetical protein
VKPGRYGGFSDTWHDLKPTSQSRGHLAIWLGRDDQRFVHRLVLEAFVGPCPPGLECLHEGGNPGNNALGNLRWGTRKENHADSVRHGTASFVKGEAPRGEAHPAAILDEPTVLAILAVRAATGKGAKGICRVMGLPDAMRGAVDGALRGQSWNHVSRLPPYQPKSHTPGRRKRAVVLSIANVRFSRDIIKPGDAA